MTDIYSFYELQIKLLREQLATCPSADIAEEHLISRAKKEMAIANRLTSKITKNLEKYVGESISEHKEVEELKGILRAYQELINDAKVLPDSIEELLVYATEVRTKFDELVANGSEKKSTVFMRSPEGEVVISGHMIQGMIKEVLRNVINSGNKTITYKSKVNLAEGMAMDLKIIEPFVKASNDIMRTKEGERDLSVRPIRFEQMGKQTTAIATSERLPVGTEYNMTLRVRKGSSIDDIEKLRFVFSHGKNSGLGAGRGSLGTGSFCFKLKALPDYKEVLPFLGDWE